MHIQLHTMRGLSNRISCKYCIPTCSVITWATSCPGFVLFFAFRAMHGVDLMCVGKGLCGLFVGWDVTPFCVI